MSDLRKYLWIAFISMVPLIELRGAIPVSQAMGLPLVPSYAVCIVANMIPVPFVYLFAQKLLLWAKDKPATKRRPKVNKECFITKASFLHKVRRTTYQNVWARSRFLPT